MNKEKRKLYKIKEMGRNGLSYTERGDKISKMKSNNSIGYLDSMTKKEREEEFKTKPITTIDKEIPFEKVAVVNNNLTKTNMDLSFFKSNRFWALVIASLVIVSEGNFTYEAWGKGLIVLLGGFTAVRTVDRFSEKLGS